MNKKNILFIAKGDEKWIAELYYVRNIIYSVFQNEKTNNYFNVYLLVDIKNIKFFESISKVYNLNIIQCQGKIGNKDVLDACKKYNINSIFPVNTYGYYGLEDICVYWIPDFQHKQLEQFFLKSEVESRDSLYKYIAENHKRLILSSNDAFNDYKRYYPNFLQGVYVVPFISYIKDELNAINDDFIKSVEKKYNLPQEYFYIANQFWMHKNHKVTFEAINIIVNEKKENVNLICTGYAEDYRNKDFFNSLKNYMHENNLKNNIRILGFIPREEQLAIMKRSICLIQPSLFEGWGTGVEDAKVLDKNIILSDILVHYEQMSRNCLTFNKFDSKDLAEKILFVRNKSKKEDVYFGMKETEKKAKEYSIQLVEAFDNNFKVDFEIIYHRLKDKLKCVFGYNPKNKNIGIYGTGEHTESMINMYMDLIGEIDFNLYFFDSNKSKWGKEYYNSKIYPSEDITNIDLERIIISSHAYQDEIYDKIKYVEETGIKVIKIYKYGENIIFFNW